MRQCRGCGTVMPPERRSPFCERCWIEHNKARNLAKTHASRERTRAWDEHPASDLLGQEDLAWLDWLNLGLAEPARRMLELERGGRGAPDGEWAETGRGVLQLYDELRPAFEERARLRPDPEHSGPNWRRFFESLRYFLS